MRAPVLRSDQSGKSLPEKPAPLANRLAQSGGVESKFVRRFIQETIAIIEEGLRRDGVVKIHHFGTFRLHQSQESKIGATINIPGRSQVVFQPDKKIRELVQLALGPKIPAGSRISLQALLEKHLTLTALPVAPEREAPIQRVVDIVETLPKPTTTFSIAEDAAEAPMALDEKLIGMDTSSQLVPNVKNEDDANAGFSLGEAIPEPAGEQSPTFAFDENGAEPEPIFPKLKRNRSRFFRGLHAGSRNALRGMPAPPPFLLLLLFVLSENIRAAREPGKCTGAITGCGERLTRR
jgi:nucleoid DNA-binding protein